MSFYSELAADADSLLAEFGQSVTIRFQAAGNYDPATGEASITNTDIVGNGAVFDYGTQAIDGTMIVLGDKQLLLSAVGMNEPGVDDLAIVGAETWRITKVNKLAPSGTAVMYDCNLRK